jgi:hypothetical protein
VLGGSANTWFSAEAYPNPRMLSEIVAPGDARRNCWSVSFAPASVNVSVPIVPFAPLP